MAESVPIDMASLKVDLFPEGEVWIARRAELDLMTQGKSRDEASRNFREALALFVDSCRRRGVLEQVAGRRRDR